MKYGSVHPAFSLQGYTCLSNPHIHSVERGALQTFFSFTGLFMNVILYLFFYLDRLNSVIIPNRAICSYVVMLSRSDLDAMQTQMST